MTFYLIGWGGVELGKRPRTRLAYFHDSTVYSWDGVQWVRCGTKADSVAVYARWHGRPSDTQIQRARRRLHPVQCPHEIWHPTPTGTAEVCYHCGERRALEPAQP